MRLPGDPSLDVEADFSAAFIFFIILSEPGTDVIILKIFSPKNFANILAFFAQTTYCSFFQKNNQNIGS
jgi:hypothetical protein